MILKALADYYYRLLEDPESEVAPPGFEKKQIPFVLVLNKDGHLVGLRDTRRGEGNKKTAREYLVPKGEKKTSGIKANLLWDAPQYLFGESQSDSKRDKERAKEAFKAFKKRIADTFPPNFRDEGISAVRMFLSRQDFTGLAKYEAWPEIVANNPNLTFKLTDCNHLIAQSDAVIRHLNKNQQQSDVVQLCCVSGKIDAPAILHSSIQGVQGAKTTGANIVSFNREAFESFHQKQGLNAPVGEQTMFAYTTALNTLLAKSSRQRLQIGGVTTVFWAEKAHSFEDELFGALGGTQKEQAADYGKMRELLTAFRTGKLHKDDDMPFYVLGLAPNGPRIIVRFWYEGNVGDLRQKIVQHFEDMELNNSAKNQKIPSLFWLMRAIAVLGKSKNIPPNLAGNFASSILTGTAYPQTLLFRAVNRCKAEPRRKGERGNLSPARVALIKGYLTRKNRLYKNTKKEVGMSLDKTNENLGYVLGRLFAMLERIQEFSLRNGGKNFPKLNKTIRDTYFSAATSNPQVTFKRLQDLSIHHLSKIKNSGESTIWLDQQMQEIMSKVPAIGVPAFLSLEDQGRFAVGYYHQRESFFSDKTKKEKEEE